MKKNEAHNVIVTLLKKEVPEGIAHARDLVEDALHCVGLSSAVVNRIPKRRIPSMTPEEFAADMREMAGNEDAEISHCGMDQLMCCLLRELGYTKGVEVFEQTKKWCA